MSADNKGSNWKEFLGVREPLGESSGVKRIVKRDGRIEKYDRWKIASAIGRAP